MTAAERIESTYLLSTSRDAAFNIFNESQRLAESRIFKEGLEDQLTHYLAEFILKIPITSFGYKEGIDPDGKHHLKARGFGEEDVLASFAQPYLIKEGLEVTPEAVEEIIDNLSVTEASLSREGAEAKGFSLLCQKIFQAPDKAFLVFISPPIQPDGYSITYIGQIKSIPQKNERVIEMTACFNNLSLDDHYGYLKSLGGNLNPELGDKKELKAEDLLLSPFALSAEQAENLGVRTILDLVINLYRLDPQASPDIRYDFNQTKQRLQTIRESLTGYLDDFIFLVGARAPKKAIDDLLDRLEQHALRTYYTEYYQDKFSDIYNPEDSRGLDFALHGAWLLSRQNMPKDGGSCPAVRQRNSLFTSVAELASNVGLEQISQLLEEFSQESGKCPDCAQAKDMKTKCCQNCAY